VTPSAREGAALQAAHWLYERAPFCLLAHTAADPRFVPANRAVQVCFGYG
jgi:hypothetical protein